MAQIAKSSPQPSPDVKGEHDQAIMDYSEAICLDPHHADALYRRGLAHRIKGENDKAIADFSETLRLNPTCDAAFLARGRIHHAKGEHDDAIADFSEAIALIRPLPAHSIIVGFPTVENVNTTMPSRTSPRLIHSPTNLMPPPVRCRTRRSKRYV
jgi:tetratricopeptide (TPR) repeat protein